MIPMKLPPFLRGNSLPLAITYVLLIGIATAMFVQARGFPAASMGPASPGFFPQVVAALIILLSLAGLIELRLEARPHVRIPRQVVFGVGAAVFYVGAMYVVGYYPSTFLFSTAIMWLVRGQASILRILVDSVILVAASYLLFDVLIDAVLPPGIVFQ